MSKIRKEDLLILFGKLEAEAGALEEQKKAAASPEQKLEVIIAVTNHRRNHEKFAKLIAQFTQQSGSK